MVFRKPAGQVRRTITRKSIRQVDTCAASHGTTMLQVHSHFALVLEGYCTLL